MAQHSQSNRKGVLTDASAGLAAARAMEEAAAAGLDRARLAAQEQELAGLREALAFEEALRQQVRDLTLTLTLTLPLTLIPTPTLIPTLVLNPSPKPHPE